MKVSFWFVLRHADSWSDRWQLFKDYVHFLPQNWSRVSVGDGCACGWQSPRKWPAWFWIVRSFEDHVDSGECPLVRDDEGHVLREDR